MSRSEQEVTSHRAIPVPMTIKSFGKMAFRGRKGACPLCALVGNRLKESVGQTNCVLLNLLCIYNVRNLTLEIKRYFESSSDAQEILIFLGKKEISIKRNIATSKGFLKMMMNCFRK